MRPPLTLVICATPRTGSTLLCALLASTDMAGRPESWFRAEDRAYWAKSWNLAPNGAGRFDRAEYLAAAIRAGQSGNGICGLRIQAPTLMPLLAELREMFGPGLADRALLERAFGPCRFLWCHRQDDVAQAISRLKAEVSQVWHLDGIENDLPKARATYDATRLDRFRAEAAEGNAMWLRWFAAEGIGPEPVIYESFAADPAARVRSLLRDLGLALPPGTVIAAPNRRMADAESAAWAARYRTERGMQPT